MIKVKLLKNFIFMGSTLRAHETCDFDDNTAELLILSGRANLIPGIKLPLDMAKRLEMAGRCTIVSGGEASAGANAEPSSRKERDLPVDRSRLMTR